MRDERRRRLGPDVVDRERMPGLDQAPGHRRPHRPRPDKPDPHRPIPRRRHPGEANAWKRIKQSAGGCGWIAGASVAHFNQDGVVPHRQVIDHEGLPFRGAELKGTPRRSNSASATFSPDAPTSWVATLIFAPLRRPLPRPVQFRPPRNGATAAFVNGEGVANSAMASKGDWASRTTRSAGWPTRDAVIREVEEASRAVGQHVEALDEAVRAADLHDVGVEVGHADQASRRRRG